MLLGYDSRGREWIDGGNPGGSHSLAHDEFGSGDGVARGVGRRFDRTGAGLSRVTEHGVLRILGGSASAFPLRPESIDSDHGSGTKKKAPAPPKPSLENPPG